MFRGRAAQVSTKDRVSPLGPASKTRGCWGAFLGLWIVEILKLEGTLINLGIQNHVLYILVDQHLGGRPCPVEDTTHPGVPDSWCQLLDCGSVCHSRVTWILPLTLARETHLVELYFK